MDFPKAMVGSRTETAEGLSDGKVRWGRKDWLKCPLVAHSGLMLLP